MVLAQKDERRRSLELILVQILVVVAIIQTSYIGFGQYWALKAEVDKGSL